MHEKRKQIIISEIKYWKQNKLLPSHYCDFLITLYAKGEQEGQVEVKETQSIIQLEKKRRNQKILFLFILAIAVSISMFIFTEIPLVTIGLAIAVLSVFLYMVFRSPIAKSTTFPFLYILCAYMLFALSMKIWFSYFMEYTILLISLLILNCLLWIITGRLLKQHYFTISGIVGILLIFGFIVNPF